MYIVLVFIDFMYFIECSEERYTLSNLTVVTDGRAGRQSWSVGVAQHLKIINNFALFLLVMPAYQLVREASEGNWTDCPEIHKLENGINKK